MAFNGSGTFNRLYTWVNDKNNNIPITASRMDDEMNGMATGLSNCICRDGQSVILANIPMAGFKFTNVGNASSRNEYATLGQLQDNAGTWGGTAGGTANAQTLTPTPPITAYALGSSWRFLPVASNTGATTMNISSLGNKNILKSIGAALVALAPNDLIINVPADIEYDGTQFVLMNPRSNAHGADIASAATLNLDAATGDLVDVTGTTTITAVTLAEGREMTVRFTGALKITNGASLVCPNAIDIYTTAGDFVTFRGYSGGVVRISNYSPIADYAPPSFRNPVVNADFAIAQRGTSFTGITNALTRTLDGWSANAGAGSSMSVSQQSGISQAGFGTLMRFGRAAGSSDTTNHRVHHVIESADCYRFQGKTVTFSIWARKGADFSGAAGLGVQITTGTGTDQGTASLLASTWTGQAATLNTTIQAASISSTLSRFTLTGVIPSNATEIGLVFLYTPSGTAGAADYLEVTGVQMEVSTGITTPFDALPYQVSLARCQRFYEKSFLQGTAPATNVGTNTGEFHFVAGKAGALAEFGCVRFLVPKRAAPTITLYNPGAANAQVRDETAGADCSASAAGSIGDKQFTVSATGNASTAVGNQLGIHWSAEASL